MNKRDFDRGPGCGCPCCYVAEDRIKEVRASNAELLAAAIAFESNLSDYCDGPERDRLRAAIGRAKGERHG